MTLLNYFDLNLILLLIGILFKLFRPKTINQLYGYRTRRSQLNQDTWNEAQNFSSKYWIIYFCITTVIAFLVNYLLPIKTSIIISIMLTISALVFLIIKTELHLRKTFDDDGNRKN